MGLIRKSLSLRVPSNVIYRALKDTRLERLFPEFFTGLTKRFLTDKANNELELITETYDSQIQINEKFKLKILSKNTTGITYITQINVENDTGVQSILQTHIANVLYALLMLETGYVNGLMERQR